MALEKYGKLREIFVYYFVALCSDSSSSCCSIGSSSISSSGTNGCRCIAQHHVQAQRPVRILRLTLRC